MEEIAQEIAGGAMFPCHETTVLDSDDELVASPTSQHCAGALIMMENQEQVNQAIRMAERIGLYDRTKLDVSVLVAGSLFEFIDHHREGQEAETCHISDAGCEAPAGYLIGGMVVPADDGGEVHLCATCGEYVCDNCSDEEGTCLSCVEDSEE